MAKTGDSVANFFKDEGAKVEVTTDSVGDPNLKVDYYGNDFSVYYVGFTAATTTPTATRSSSSPAIRQTAACACPRSTNGTTNNRFARAYVSEEGSARIEMDVLLGNDGMSPDDFALAVGIWNRALQDFENSSTGKFRSVTGS